MTTTNTSLIRRLCSAGDHNSWVDFVTTYESMIRSYVANRSQSRGLRLDDYDLNDIIQTVWIKLWKQFDNFELDKQRGRFRTFLYTVTINTLVDFIRKNRTHTKGRTLIEPIDIADTRTKPDDDWDLAYRAALWERVSVSLKEKLVRENPAKWSSFERHKIHGVPARDVAKELSITPDLVYQNVARVMKEARTLCLAISEEELVDDRP